RSHRKTSVMGCHTIQMRTADRTGCIEGIRKFLYLNNMRVRVTFFGSGQKCAASQGCLGGTTPIFSITDVMQGSLRSLRASIHPFSGQYGQEPSHLCKEEVYTDQRVAIPN